MSKNVDFEYTDERDVLGSSAVDQLFYNENEQYLVIDWKDELYRYDGVTRAEFEAVAEGERTFSGRSVGRAAQALKRRKGPGRYVGNYNETTERKVDVKSLTSVGASSVTSAPTPYTPKDLKTDSTKEYSLKTPAAPSATYEVFFNGGKSHTPSGVNSVDEAVAALEEVSKILGVTFKAEKVVVTFV